MLSDPLYQSLIIMDPGAALRHRICTDSYFGGVLDDCLNTPIASVVDLRLRNIAELRPDGLDLAGASELPSPVGKLSGRVQGTYFRHYLQLQTPAAPVASLLKRGAQW